MAVGNAPRTSLGYLSQNAGFGAAFADALETVVDLSWPDSVITYGKMRTDPQLQAVIAAYTLPLRQAPKHVDPAGCRSEVVQLIADDLGLPILGIDNNPGPARRRGVDFDDHFRLALLNLTFGHMPFAQRYEIINGQARLVELSERMPASITDILLTDDGKLDGILQYGEKQIIPAEHLVWYVHEREGSAYQGRSMLRSAYGAWLLKHDMWRVLGISSRRFGMGVSTVEAPAGATPAQLEQAALLASAIRAGDQAGAGLPHGFVHKLTGVSGGVPDTLEFVRYLDQQMAQMALASVLNLDASPNGSRALGDTFINLMLTSLNAIAGEMSTVLTRLAVQMVDYNFGEQENVPRIVIGDAGSRPEVTAESIQLLMNCGALSPDPALEAFVRERWSLPEREETPEPPTPVLPEPPSVDDTPEDAPETVPTPESRTAVARRKTLRASTRRQLSQVEAASAVDPDTLDQQWTTAVDDLINNWATIGKAQRKQITDQIKAAVNDDAIDALATLAVDSSDGADKLAAAMLAMSGTAATEMKREAREQGVSVSGEEIDEDRLSSIAAAVAALVGSGLAGAAGREALRVWASGDSGKDVASKVDDHLKGLSDSYLRDQLGNALSTAQNVGRHAVMHAAPPAKYYASEVLDSNTCKQCRAIDGQQFTDMDQAEQAYASGGYTLCLGKLRCRGIVVAVWDD